MRNGPADPNCSGSEVGEIKQREVVRAADRAARRQMQNRIMRQGALGLVSEVCGLAGW